MADVGNHIIRMISPAGVVSTVAGTAGQTGNTNGTGAAARFHTPTGVAVDAEGNIYVADSGNHRIRKIAAGGVVTTLAGASVGYTDGTSAAFRQPTGVAVDGSGNVFVADLGNNMIRRVTSAGVVSTVTAQNTVADYYDGPSAGARFRAPYAVAVDAAGNLYVSDSGNHAIRVGLVSPTAPAITTQPTSTTVNSSATATFTVAASGSLPPGLQWQVSTDNGSTWSHLSESAPYSGVTTTTLTVTNVTASLTGRRYRAVATNQSGTATSDAATLTVRFVAATPTTLRFGAIKAGASGALTAVTPAQTVIVTFSSTTGTWTATSDQSWAVVSGGSGTGNGQFSVAIANPSNVIGASTSLSATLTITPASGTGLAAATVPVTLAIDQTGTSSQPPIGQMDTPTQNATGIQGAISVTGWVLDDLGIASVKVYRNCLPAEPQINCQDGLVSGASLVYIGDAQLVAGARPDVEAAFPTYAAGHTAGWGIQVLSNMLPRATGTFAAYGGQGPLTLYAVATDIEGNRVLLSRAYTDTVRTPTSITMDNDTIAKPFGTIDTPAEGAVVAGTVANFGWALTPDSNTSADGTDILIPTTGATMVVFVDGVATATVAYNQCRGNVGNPPPAGVYCNDDVANIFGNATPQPTFTTRTANPTRYRNLDATRSAIGAYDVTTTSLSPGLHSLAWSVTDSANRIEGIGSRYIYVLNSGDAPVDAAAATEARLAARGSVRSLTWVPTATGAVAGRAGFDLAAPLVAVVAEADGVRRVRLAPAGRLELWIEGVTAGYLAANADLRGLPVGAHLDTATGVFTWAPGPGYLGTYRLEFLTVTGRVPVEVTLAPPMAPAAGTSEIRLHVDAPALSERTWRVEGWAYDPQAFTGSGIGAVHVWARRVDVPTTGPTFVGAATLDQPRPDVAAAFGLRTDRTGYGLTAALAPGRYAITIYAWNLRTHRWEDARTIEVTVR